MNAKVFDIQKKSEYNMAGPYDLIKLVPVPGSHSLYIYKYILEILTYSIVNQEFVHVSGPTGSAKSSLIEAFSFRQRENFKLLCNYLDYKYKPVLTYEIEMVIFDTPGELYQRRGIKNNETIDIQSDLVKAISEANKKSQRYYVVINLREMGRVHTASVQGGLLNLMTKSNIVTPTQEQIEGGNVCFIADSNYQAVEDALHTLVPFDSALQRRFTINILLNYLPEMEEIIVLKEILGQQFNETDIKLIETIVHLGHVIRQHKSEGTLNSVIFPTINGYLTCYKMAVDLGHDIDIAIQNTLLGNVSTEDQKLVDSIMLNVFNSSKSTKSKQSFLENSF